MQSSRRFCGILSCARLSFVMILFVTVIVSSLIIIIIIIISQIIMVVSIIVMYFLFDVVLKSDNANGLFGFESVSAIAVDESSNVTLTIERSMGKFGTATVNWSVYKGSSSVPASSDFTLDNGSVVFSENEEKKVCFWFFSLGFLVGPRY